MAGLTDEDRARYARHLSLPQVGEQGQSKLKQSRVFCVGAGGLGSPALLYLAAAGIGHLTVIDDDAIERSNLQRQIMHADDDVGISKAESAMLRLRELNPSISIEVYAERLTAENAMMRVQGHDIVLDGTDNIPTRYLINDVCELLGTPWVYGSIYRFEGQVSVFNLDGGPTYRDLFPSPPPPEAVPSCEDGGVLGVLPGVVGSIQATEVIKVLIGIGEPLRGKLLVYDALEMSMRTLTFAKLEREPVTKLIDYEGFCGTKSMQMPFAEICPTEYIQRRSEGWDPLFIDTRNSIEASIVTLPETDALIPHEEILLTDLPKDRDIVLYCRTGGRSGMAAYALSQTGYNPSNLYNLSGGIHAWHVEIDSSIPKY
jgi:molybdopterin/thiamine biosynthesis adenylyltransferase/rhodanese-related sulfurtransferase